MGPMNNKYLKAVEMMTAYDTRAIHWVLSRRDAARLAAVARQVSRLGDGPFYALLGITLFLLDGDRGTGFFSQALLAFLLELPLYVWLKRRIRRPRPADSEASLRAFIKPSDQFSFPSGHTAAAFLMATLILVHYPLWAALALPVAALIGLSRVVLGVHFPTDILAGAVLGGACAGVSLLIY